MHRIGGQSSRGGEGRGFGYLGAFTTGGPRCNQVGWAVGSIRRYASNKRLIARDSSSWHRLFRAAPAVLRTIKGIGTYKTHPWRSLLPATPLYAHVSPPPPFSLLPSPLTRQIAHYEIQFNDHFDSGEIPAPFWMGMDGTKSPVASLFRPFFARERRGMFFFLEEGNSILDSLEETILNDPPNRFLN